MNVEWTGSLLEQTVFSTFLHLNGDNTLLSPSHRKSCHDDFTWDPIGIIVRRAMDPETGLDTLV